MRVRLYFGEQEQLLYFQPELGDFGRDASDYRHHEPVIEGPYLSDIDFGHEHLLF